MALVCLKNWFPGRWRIKTITNHVSKACFVKTHCQTWHLRNSVCTALRPSLLWREASNQKGNFKEMHQISLFRYRLEIWHWTLALDIRYDPLCCAPCTQCWHCDMTRPWASWKFGWKCAGDRDAFESVFSEVLGTMRMRSFYNERFWKKAYPCSLLMFYEESISKKHWT